MYIYDKMLSKTAWVRKFNFITKTCDWFGVDKDILSKVYNLCDTYHRDDELIPTLGADISNNAYSTLGCTLQLWANYKVNTAYDIKENAKYEVSVDLTSTPDGSITKNRRYFDTLNEAVSYANSLLKDVPHNMECIATNDLHYPLVWGVDVSAVKSDELWLSNLYLHIAFGYSLVK